MFKNNNIYISKLYFNKVFAEEFKPIHTREMVVDASYGNMHTLSETIASKRTFSLSTDDLITVPDLITLSDIPSADSIAVNGGWGMDRYSFMMEITVEEMTSTTHLYLTGYTDRDDLFSLQSRAINPDILLIFNDCLVTQTTYPNGIPSVRIVNNIDILPNPETQDYRTTTLRPSDCFTYIEGMMLKDTIAQHDKENGKSDDVFTFSDTRTQNRGGRVADKRVSSLDAHLTTVANNYIQASIKSTNQESVDDAISDITWHAREQAIYTTVDLFKLLWKETNEAVTNNVQLGTLLKVAPMGFKDAHRDYLINEKRRGDLDKELKSIANIDENFKALATSDSESTNVISVEVKLAQLFLQELVSLMGLYKITRLAITATNEETDFDGNPIVIASGVSTIVSDLSISKLLIDNFTIAFTNKVFNKICKNNNIAVCLYAYVGFNSERVEISINSQSPIVIALPKFMSNAATPLVGTVEELRNLSGSYRDMFASLDGNVEDIKRSNTGGILMSTGEKRIKY